METNYFQLDTLQNHSQNTTKIHQQNLDCSKKDLGCRLFQIEGQIREIKRLIVRDTYFDDVITQITATQSALNDVAEILLAKHIKNSIDDSIQKEDHEVINDLLVSIQRLLKYKSKTLSASK